MMNSSLGDLEATKNYHGDNNTSEFTEELIISLEEWSAFVNITLLICSFGLVGNGYIIWLLGFHIKRNCFTTFILNLAIADFGFLTSVVIALICGLANLVETIFGLICYLFFSIMYVNSHILMMAISIDQCVAVLFPIWHHSSWPKHLSPAVCVILWTSSFLLCGILEIMSFTKVIVYRILTNLHFLVTTIICLPLITLSTVVLFIKVCVKLNQKNQGWLLLMVLITLVCFHILSFPYSVIKLIGSFPNFETDKKLKYLNIWGLLLSCLNRTINPVIYFVVGRKKGAQSKETVQVILENVFKEGEAMGGR